MTDLEGISDAVTKLKTPTQYGRFNYKMILNELHLKHTSENVGIFYCGPPSLSSHIKYESYRYDCFSFHSEEF